MYTRLDGQVLGSPGAPGRAGTCARSPVRRPRSAWRRARAAVLLCTTALRGRRPGSLTGTAGRLEEVAEGTATFGNVPSARRLELDALARSFADPSASATPRQRLVDTSGPRRSPSTSGIACSRDIRVSARAGQACREGGLRVARQVWKDGSRGIVTTVIEHLQLGWRQRASVRGHLASRGRYRHYFPRRSTYLTHARPPSACAHRPPSWEVVLFPG